MHHLYGRIRRQNLTIYRSPEYANRRIVEETAVLFFALFQRLLGFPAFSDFSGKLGESNYFIALNYRVVRDFKRPNVVLTELMCIFNTKFLAT